MRSHQTQEDGEDERSANAPPPLSSIHSAPSAAGVRSQAARGGSVVSKHVPTNGGVNEFLESVSEPVLKQQIVGLNKA